MGNATAKRKAIATAVSRGDGLELAGMMDQLSTDDRHHGKYYDEGDEEGRTPLHHASSMGFVVGVELLLRTGANKNKLDRNGCSPLYLAVANQQLDVVELLIRKRVDLDHAFTATSTLDGEVAHEPPLHHAADCGLLDMVKMLVRAGADPNKRFSDVVEKKYSRCTPLHRASHNGHADVVQALIGAGGGINHVEGNGNTPIHLAAFRGHLAVCKVLVESGQVDWEMRNDKNHTAFDMAKTGGYKLIEDYFEQVLQKRLSHDPLQRHSMSMKAAMAKKDTSVAAAMARRANVNEAALLNVPAPSPSEKKLFVAFRNVTQSMSKMVSSYRMGGQVGGGGGDHSDGGSSYIESVGQSSVYQSGDDYDCESQSETMVIDKSSHLGDRVFVRKFSVSSKGTIKQDAAATVTSEVELKLPALFTSTTSSSSHHSSAANSGYSSASTFSGHVNVAGNTTPVNLGNDGGGGGDGTPRSAAMMHRGGGMGFMPSMLQTASILALSMRGNRFCAEDGSEGSDNDGDPTNEGGSIEQLRNLLEQHNIGRHGLQNDDPYKDINGNDNSDSESDDDDVHDVFASCYERQQRENTPARSPVHSKAPSSTQSRRSSLKHKSAPEVEFTSSLPGTSPSRRPSSANSKLSLPYLVAAGLASSSNKEIHANAKDNATNSKNDQRSGTSTPIMPRLTTATAAMSTMGTLSAAASALSSPSLRSPRR